MKITKKTHESLQTAIQDTYITGDSAVTSLVKLVMTLRESKIGFTDIIPRLVAGGAINPDSTMSLEIDELLVQDIIMARNATSKNYLEPEHISDIGSLVSMVMIPTIEMKNFKSGLVKSLIADGIDKDTATGQVTRLIGKRSIYRKAVNDKLKDVRKTWLKMVSDEIVSDDKLDFIPENLNTPDTPTPEKIVKTQIVKLNNIRKVFTDNDEVRSLLVQVDKIDASMNQLIRLVEESEE
tara:strand:+ start:2112 stop:2825 length:714 start_codon:yes stop_codon:yes gene_type:complete